MGTRLAVYIFGLDEVLVISGNGQFMFMENSRFAGFLLKCILPSVTVCWDKNYKNVAYVRNKIINLSCNEMYYFFNHS